MCAQRLAFRGESQAIDAEVRASAPGQFADLPDGMVHYEIAGSPRAETVLLIPGEQAVPDRSGRLALASTSFSPAGGSTGVWRMVHEPIG